MNDEPTHEQLVAQANAVLEAVKGSMYWPVAYGEAQKLQNKIKEKKSEAVPDKRQVTKVDDLEDEKILLKCAECGREFEAEVVIDEVKRCPFNHN